MPSGKCALSHTSWTQAPPPPLLTLLAPSWICFVSKAAEADVAETLGKQPQAKTANHPGPHPAMMKGAPLSTSDTPLVHLHPGSAWPLVQRPELPLSGQLGVTETHLCLKMLYSLLFRWVITPTSYRHLLQDTALAWAFKETLHISALIH